jgi:hypothetical protein
MQEKKLLEHHICIMNAITSASYPNVVHCGEIHVQILHRQGGA